MSLGEFTLETPPPVGDISGPAMSLQDAEGVSVKELEGVLDVIAEELVLVHRSTGEIMWMSSACRGVTHKLGATKNIDEFPSLRKMINEVTPDESGFKLQARWQTTDAQWKQHIGDNRKSSISVLVRPENHEHIWVRFYRSSEQEDYVRQTLAQQEKLFSTSRSISVSEMVTTLAHELNQPLGTLVNLMNGIKTRLKNDSSEGSADVFEALDLAQKQGQFASDILLRLRDFAQSKKPATDKCNVSALIGDTLELLDWVFVEEGVNVNFNIRDEEIVLVGDATLLQQVLVNLLRNSVEAMNATQEGEKRIDITVSSTDDKVKLSISDTGHGIDDDYEDALFTPFKSRKANGMGVGLNICRSFIELHEGKFWFTQNEYRGCTANIVIPNRLSNES